jgi:hypothetical protein
MMNFTTTYFSDLGIRGGGGDGESGIQKYGPTGPPLFGQEDFFGIIITNKLSSEHSSERKL